MTYDALLANFVSYIFSLFINLTENFMMESPIKKFKRNVIEHGADACLPVNLSDEWLDYLDAELACLDDEESDLSCSLAAIVTILMAKNAHQDEYSATVDELFDKIIEFKIEIGLEIVMRRTEIKYKPANLDNIFTNREIEVVK